MSSAPLRNLRLAAVALCVAALSGPSPLADYETPKNPGWQEPIDVVEIDSTFAPPMRKLDWEHWGFDLYLADLEEVDGRARLRFYLELKFGLERAWTWLGFPRYKNASGRWHDAVIQGPLGRSRVVTASREAGERFFFSVLVRPLSTVS